MGYKEKITEVDPETGKEKKRTVHVQRRRHRTKHAARVRQLKRARPAGLSLRKAMAQSANDGDPVAKSWIANKKRPPGHRVKAAR